MRKLILLLVSSLVSMISFAQFTETFEVFPLTQWTTTGTGVTSAQNTTYYQEGSSSVQLTYLANANGHLTMSNSINLSTITSPKLTFWQIVASEANLDFTAVEY